MSPIEERILKGLAEVYKQNELILAQLQLLTKRLEQPPTVTHVDPPKEFKL